MRRSQFSRLIILSAVNRIKCPLQNSEREWRHRSRTEPESGIWTAAVCEIDGTATGQDQTKNNQRPNHRQNPKKQRRETAASSFDSDRLQKTRLQYNSKGAFCICTCRRSCSIERKTRKMQTRLPKSTWNSTSPDVTVAMLTFPRPAYR